MIFAQNSQKQFPVTTSQPTINIDQQKQQNSQASGGNTPASGLGNNTSVHGLQSQQQVCVHNVLDARILKILSH